MSDEKRIEQEDLALIRRIAAKQSDALDAFYTRYNRLAFTVVLRILQNREDAEDVLVDVFWQVWKQADPFVLADTRQAVQAALQTLPEQQRIPLEMAFFQGMSHSEIAKALGQPLGTIKDRVRNGMMHLKKRLRPDL